MSLLKAAVLLVAISVAAGTFYDFGSGYALTSIQKDALAKDIENTILSVQEADEDGKLFYPFVAGFVRLAFHQCVSGKCIGCINLNDPNNRHLGRYVDALELVRQRNPFVRYGDLWALGGHVALQVSERFANKRSGRLYSYTSTLQFRYGREDCPTAPYTTNIYPFPSFNKGLDHVLSFFSLKFGLADYQVVALLGAHALGGFRHSETGRILRQWTSSPDCLDNSYYKFMQDGGQNWHQSPQLGGGYGAGQQFWVNGFDKRLMLNSDMCLLKDLQFANGIEGVSTCNFGTCRGSKTAFWINTFSLSNDAWLVYFVNAFTRMTENGYPLLTLKNPKVCYFGVCL